VPYYIDADKMSLDDIKKRIEETDLVPSRIMLKDNIDEQFEKFKEYGFLTLADLRKELKNTKNIPSLSKKTGVNSDYLTLLRREIESYFPRAFPLSSFGWLPKEELAKLENLGYKNSVLLFETLNSPETITKLSNELEFAQEFIDNIYALIDLTRIQWVSPIAARILVAAGYNNAKMVSIADADELCSRLDKVNKDNQFFKGKIGLRDIKRLVKSASYVP